LDARSTQQEITGASSALVLVTACRTLVAQVSFVGGQRFEGTDARRAFTPGSDATAG
jgi:hypothetical protein